MYKKTRREYGSLIFIVGAIFFIGVLLGSISYFSMGKDMEHLLEGVVVNEGQSYDFKEMFKICFFTEGAWVTLTWLISQIGFISPFTLTVVGIRGFVLGFTVSFVLNANGMALKILLKTIVPQCLFALPILTFVAATSVVYAVKDKRNVSALNCISIELIALVLAAVVAVLECLFAYVL